MNLTSVAPANVLDLAGAKLGESGLTLEDAGKLGITVLGAAQVTALGCKASVARGRAALRFQYHTADGAPREFLRLRFLGDPGPDPAAAAFGAESSEPARFWQTESASEAPCAVYYPQGLGIDWPGLLADPDKMLIITEGEAKAACGIKYGFPVIALGGVYNWKASKKGVSFLAELETVAWDGRLIIVVFDTDPNPNTQRNVRRATEAFAAELERRGAVVRAATLPALDATGKVGLDDLLVRRGATALQAALDAAAPVRPTINVTTDEVEVTEQALNALTQVPEVYVRALVLTHLVRGATDAAAAIERKRKREPDAPYLAAVPLSWIEQYLSRAACWQELTKKGAKRVRPPFWAVRQVYDAPAYPGMRRLRGVVETPVLRPDGTILTTPGYDDETELLYIPLKTVAPIPENPTKADAQRAWEVLFEEVRQFPFEEVVHQAAWLAAVLTPFARWSFDGPTPLFFFDANIRGAGKTKLATAAGIISLGRVPALTTWNNDDPAENKKAITALLMEGSPLVIFDNVEGRFGDQSIKKLLTGEIWTERILGVNKTTGALPNLTTWFATANNVQLKGKDMARRMIVIRLRSDLERPEERTDVVHTEFERWILSQRPRLAAAALTILRAFAVAGRPDTGLASSDYPGWCRAVRDAVVWLGLPDPVASRQRLSVIADEESAEHRALVEVVAGVTAAVGAQTAADLLDCLRIGRAFDAKKVAKSLTDAEVADLRTQLLQFCHARNHPEELPTTHQLGLLLAKHRDAVVDGQRITGETGRGGAVRWRVEQVGSVVGDTGDEPGA